MTAGNSHSFKPKPAFDTMTTPATFGPPRLEIDGQIATLTLQRPAVANRLEPDDLTAIVDAIDTVDATPEVRVLILTGTGKHFCSGFDIVKLSPATPPAADNASAAAQIRLGDSAPSDPSLLQMPERAAHRAAWDATPPSARFGVMVDRVETARPVTIAAINGGVYGGATDLALACDFRLGLARSEAFMPAARLGLHFYPSGLQRFVSRLGLNVAKRFFLTAERFDAQQLLNVGFLDQIVDEPALLDEARAFAQRIAALAPLAVQGMKQSLNQAGAGWLDHGQAHELMLMTLASEDLAEGARAFAAKRQPVFSGR